MTSSHERREEAAEAHDTPTAATLTSRRRTPAALLRRPDRDHRREQRHPATERPPVSDDEIGLAPGALAMRDQAEAGAAAHGQALATLWIYLTTTDMRPELAETMLLNYQHGALLGTCWVEVTDEE